MRMAYGMATWYGTRPSCGARVNLMATYARAAGGLLRGQARAGAGRLGRRRARGRDGVAQQEDGSLFRQRGAVLEVSLSVKVLAARLPGRAIIS